MAMAHMQGPLYSQLQPIALLILVENSSAVSNVWTDLRDHHLVNLAANIKAEVERPIVVSVLESYPCQDHGPNPSPPHQHSDAEVALRDVKFNPNPDNKISIGRINTCIDFLDSFKYQGQPAALHLIIVAATAPSDDNTDRSTGSDYSPWFFLAKKMADKNIYCHIVVSPQHDKGSLTTLFEETLRLQNNVEGRLHPPVDPSRMVIRVSTMPTHQHYMDAASANLYSPQRTALPRRSSYPNPAENFYSEGFEPVSAPATNEGDPPPSLVSQLQQVHGLTKKKVYGAKPARQPFFREERVRDKYRTAPAPLTMPLPAVDQIPSPTAGGRAISQSRAERMARVGQGSPTELHARRQQHGAWPRRGSRLSTPEPDNLSWPASSPSAYHDTSPRSSYIASVSSDISSPVTPGAMSDIYGIPQPIASMPSTSMHGITPVLTGYQTGGMPEPGWPQQQAQQQQQQQQQQQYTDVYSAVPTSYFPPAQAPSQFYNSNGEYTHKDIMQPLEQTTPSPPAYNPYMMDCTPAMMLPPAPAAPTPVPEPAPRAAPEKRAAPQPDEERFTFSEDFVAATAALFDVEVLPSYPNYPGMSSGLLPRGGMPPPQSAAQPGELYATRVRSSYPPARPPPPPVAAPTAGTAHAHPLARAPYGNPYPQYPTYNTPAYPPAYPPAYGSSLTGWAG
ncbi:hypothetical protein HYPSUDRAFT_207373 [Hypholoma sublateritium FD-334 SS-4]|uniref:Uncharacterized protein n=1 Tax=Hypholoma sublateritium (strain FD-334 SS-4) TaxID=945553 RepID=A0A0D2LYU7_HYPSF|nr:hypothetical protein HYPSUDRAFT_207373 [Hypholoma sublateritium FD-334 SS-4]